MNIEPQVHLATDPASCERELDKLRRLATACERNQNAFEILETYIQACDTFSRMQAGFVIDEAMLAGLEQTANVLTIRGTLQSISESMLRSIACVECRLISAGVLGYPGQA